MSEGEDMEHIKFTGVTSRGIRLPILKKGDDLKNAVITSILDASENEGFELNDRDVIAITESIVARVQGNYCTVDDIAADIKSKIGEDGNICVLYPILSRNRFSILLKGIAKAAKEVTLVLSYPSDEVGNALITYDQLDDNNIDPSMKTLDIKEYRKLFGKNTHEFTGVDYVQYYQDLIEAEGAKCQILFSNRTKYIASMGFDAYIAADIHTRERTKKLITDFDPRNTVFGLDDIMNKPINGSGYNARYGLLGSNKADEETVKLFPRDAEELLESIQKEILTITGKKVEVMVYGDGAFKDPQGKIWELADPVVSPFYTDGLVGTPNEIKLKYMADNKFKDLHGKELQDAIKDEIKAKEANLKGNMSSEGTTPRKITDLLGSLADLTSGSGDKGTPVVLIQGYFNNYAD